MFHSDLVDPAPRRPLKPGERWTIGLLLGLFAAAVFADLARNAHPAVWTVPFILLAWIPLLVVHEAGHAIAAWLVGWRVHKIVIGFGRDVARFRIGETRVILKRIPAEGFVVPVPVGTRFARLKNAFVYFSGPGFEMAVLGAIVVVVGPETLLVRSDDVTLLALQSVSVAVCIGLFFNLIPRSTSDGHVSDGMGILVSATLPAEHFEDAATRPVLEEADRLVERGEAERARAVVEEALEKSPDSLPLHAMRAICLAAGGDGEAASEALDRLGRPDAKRPSRAVELLHARARVGLEAPSPERLRDAELSCDAALVLFPNHTPFEITLGAVLFERGRAEQATEILSRALASARDTEQQGRCLAYLALAAHRVGDLRLAQECLAAFRDSDPSPRLLNRVAEALGA